MVWPKKTRRRYRHFALNIHRLTKWLPLGMCAMRRRYSRKAKGSCLAVHDSAEAVLQLLVKKSAEREGELKRGQALKGDWSENFTGSCINSATC